MMLHQLSNRQHFYHRLLAAGGAIALTLLPVSMPVNAQELSPTFGEVEQLLNETLDEIKDPDLGAREITITRINNTTEEATQSTITITEKGFLDDSVHGAKKIIHLQKDQLGNWTVTDIQQLYICQRGRGSQTGSAELCI